MDTAPTAKNRFPEAAASVRPIAVEARIPRGFPETAADEAKGGIIHRNPEGTPSRIPGKGRWAPVVSAGLPIAAVLRISQSHNSLQGIVAKGVDRTAPAAARIPRVRHRNPNNEMTVPAGALAGKGLAAARARKSEGSEKADRLHWNQAFNARLLRQVGISRLE